MSKFANITDANAEIERLEAALKELQTAKSQADEAVKTATATADTAKKEAADAKAENATLQASLTELTASVATLKTDVASLLKDLSATKASIKTGEILAAEILGMAGNKGLKTDGGNMEGKTPAKEKTKLTLNDHFSSIKLPESIKGILKD